MSMELIGIVSATITLAALILTAGGMTSSAIRSLRKEMREEMKELRGEVNGQRGEMLAMGDKLREAIDALAGRVGALERKMARLEGLLEGVGLTQPAQEAPKSAVDAD